MRFNEKIERFKNGLVFFETFNEKSEKIGWEGLNKKFTSQRILLFKAASQASSFIEK